MEIIFLVLGVEALLIGALLLYIYGMVKRDIKKYNEKRTLIQE